MGTRHSERDETIPVKWDRTYDDAVAVWSKATWKKKAVFCFVLVVLSAGWFTGPAVEYFRVRPLQQEVDRLGGVIADQERHQQAVQQQLMAEKEEHAREVSTLKMEKGFLQLRVENLDRQVREKYPGLSEDERWNVLTNLVSEASSRGLRSLSTRQQKELAERVRAAGIGGSVWFLAQMSAADAGDLAQTLRQALSETNLQVGDVALHITIGGELPPDVTVRFDPAYDGGAKALVEALKAVGIRAKLDPGRAPAADRISASYLIVIGRGTRD